MFCSNCGAQIPDDSKYCPVCGTNVSNLPYADTDNRKDTELHVEYLRLTPSSEAKVEQAKKQNLNRGGYIFATITNVITVLTLLLFFASMPIYNIFEKSSNFANIWLITVGAVALFTAALNLILLLVLKPVIEIFGRQTLRQNYIVRILFIVIAVLLNVAVYVGIYVNPHHMATVACTNIALFATLCISGFASGLNGMFSKKMNNLPVKPR